MSTAEAPPETRGERVLAPWGFDPPELGLGPPEAELGLAVCWTRGGLTVTSLQREFNDAAWAPRGRCRALKQFVMNWNSWPRYEDRGAMLDGPPPPDMPEDEQARVAAVVHCLCERDGRPLPEWVPGRRARRRGGVMLIGDDYCRTRLGLPGGFFRYEKRDTPAAARPHRVWFRASLLNAN